MLRGHHRPRSVTFRNGDWRKRPTSRGEFFPRLARSGGTAPAEPEGWLGGTDYAPDSSSTRHASANVLRGFLCNVVLSISPRRQNASLRVSISCELLNCILMGTYPLRSGIARHRHRPRARHQVAGRPHGSHLARDFAPVCWPTWSVKGSPRHVVRVCGWANARSRSLASGSRTQDRRRSKVDRARPRNAPLCRALDLCVR
jgi:hypothetical protein